MNKTPYDDWLVKLLNKMQRMLIILDEYKKAFIKKFKYTPKDKELKQEIKKGIIGYSKRIQGASTTPKGHGFRSYKYIKFTLTDDYERLLMTKAKDLDVYFIDYSYLDLSDKVFYIKGKSAAQRFLLLDTELPYRDTHNINKFIASKEPFDNKFYVEEVTSSEYKEAPDNKKIKIVKDITP